MAPAREEPTGRRAELLSAAQSVIARGGLRALTHRAVDAQAGLSVGTCSAYYRTRSALLTSTSAHVASQLTDRVLDLQSRLEPVADPSSRHEVMIDWFMARLAEPELLLVQVELALEAVRSPELAEEIGRWRRVLLRIVEGMVCAYRPDAPPERAEALLAALFGVLTWTVSEDPEHQRLALAATLDAFASD